MTTRVTNNNHLATLAILAAITLFGGLTTPAGAVPYMEASYGGQSPFISAEVNSLASTGVGVYRGGFSTFLNPAGLARATEWRLDAGGALLRHDEERYSPLYDSFDSFVVDKSIASNQHMWLETGFALAGQLQLGDLPLGVGLSLADRLPFGYEFTEEVRDPDVFSTPRDRILEERTYEIEGTVRTLSLGVAGEADKVSAGAAVHYNFGDRSEHWLLRDNITVDGDRSFDSLSEWDLSGVNFTLGLQVQPTERLTLGVAYESPLTLDGDINNTHYEAAVDTFALSEAFHGMEMPARWRFGGAFMPRNDPRTVFTVDVVVTDYEELTDDRPGLNEQRNTDPAELQKVVDVRVGLQHTFNSGQDMNFGFRRYDSYNDDEGGNSVFSAGTSWPVGPGKLALSFEINKLQNGYVPHLFDYPEGFVSPEEARIDDTRLRIGLGWTQTF